MVECGNCGEKEEITVEFVGSGKITKVDGGKNERKIYVKEPNRTPIGLFCSSCGNKWGLKPTDAVCV